MVHDLVDARVEVLAGVVAVLDVAEAPRPVREVIGELRQRQPDRVVVETAQRARREPRLHDSCPAARLRVGGHEACQ